MIDRIVVWALALKAKLSEERGQDLIEYGLLGGFIALVIMGLALTIFQDSIGSMFTGIGNCIDFDSLTDCTPF